VLFPDMGLVSFSEIELEYPVKLSQELEAYC